MEFPRVISRKTTAVSPWMNLVDREVQFREGGPIERYHSVNQAAYVSILALTRSGKIPIVKQYRPAVEGFTLEFPAGTIDADENAAAAASRELLEETGLRADELFEVGNYYPDTGRLSVGSVGFVAKCGEDVPGHVPESGIEVRFVTLGTLFEMIRSGEFRHQLHIALVASALAHGRITLPGR
jgi:ADP-ribose pyrophosphatase